jgi:hypothetical protein
MLTKTIEQISECSRLLDKAVSDLKTYMDTQRDAKVKYLAAEAYTLRNSDGKNSEARKADAVLENQLELADLMNADTDVTVCKERIRMLHAQLSALQTVARAEQTQWMAEPTGQWT